MSEIHTFSISAIAEPSVVDALRDKILKAAVDVVESGATVTNFTHAIDDLPADPVSPARSTAKKTASAPTPTQTTKQRRAIVKWSGKEITELTVEYERQEDTTVRDVWLNSRITKALQRAHITTVDQVLNRRPSDLLSITSFGVVMLARLEELLELQGLSLPED